jgi:hypothetical protein
MAYNKDLQYFNVLTQILKIYGWVQAGQMRVQDLSPSGARLFSSTQHLD